MFNPLRSNYLSKMLKFRKLAEPSLCSVLLRGTSSIACLKLKNSYWPSTQHHHNAWASVQMTYCWCSEMDRRNTGNKILQICANHVLCAWDNCMVLEPQLSRVISIIEDGTLDEEVGRLEHSLKLKWLLAGWKIGIRSPKLLETFTNMIILHFVYFAKLMFSTLRGPHPLYLTLPNSQHQIANLLRGAALCIFYEMPKIKEVFFNMLWNNGMLKQYFVKIEKI